MTLLTSRRRRTMCALVTTLAAGSLTFAACTSDRGSVRTSDEEPARVATAMGTGESEASTSTPGTATLHNTASWETTLTARAFMDYLDEGQREQILGDGLELNELTRAQQITVLKVLETLLNENAYRTVAATLDYITTNPGAEPHHLRFSEFPSMDEQWKLDLDGPKMGLHALFADDGTITFESAYFALNSGDVHAILTAAGVDDDHSRLPMVEVSAHDLLNSLSDQQRDVLAGTSVAGGGGLRGADLTDSQRQMLIDVTTNWICLGDESTVMSKQSKIVDTLDETSFMLSDDPEGAGADGLIFRVDGPEVFIEFNMTPAGDGQASIRSVFEDPSLTGLNS